LSSQIGIRFVTVAAYSRSAARIALNLHPNTGPASWPQDISHACVRQDILAFCMEKTKDGIISWLIIEQWYVHVWTFGTNGRQLNGGWHFNDG
jgi:hypothetical protein